MKLRNKKTGEIDDFIFEVIKDRIDLYRRVGYSENKNVWHYNSLVELNDEWEDVPEELKEYWYIGDSGEVWEFSNNYYLGTEIEETHREIGNLFETKEEAEKAVEKLKAWKRLKDYNVKFNLDFVKNKIDFTYSINNPLLDVLDGEEQIFNNLKIVFGDEE